MEWEKSNNFNVSLLLIQQTSTESLLLLRIMLSTGDRAVGKNLVDVDDQTFIYKEVQKLLYVIMENTAVD